MDGPTYDSLLFDVRSALLWSTTLFDTSHAGTQLSTVFDREIASYLTDIDSCQNMPLLRLNFTCSFSGSTVHCDFQFSHSFVQWGT